eukprot:NODE_495_length_6825_cov_1.481267.p1 type:complete len:1155 gc:universal NODE_495_length_6825_cov_1.481267:1429-4893(+)
MFQSSLQKLNIHLKQNYEYPSQKQQILQSIQENLSKSPLLMLDVLVKYSQVDKLPQSYVETILNSELQLKPNEMLMMGQLIYLSVKTCLQNFEKKDIDYLLLCMRKLYAYYKQSNSSQLGALFLQLTQPSDSNESLKQYYNDILLVLCKLSVKYSDELPLFCIMYLAKQKYFNYNVLLPMTLNLKRSSNNIISTHLLSHTIELQPLFPYHFEIYYKLFLTNFNEHSISVLSNLDCKYWIEWYINYDCNPLMQINLLEKIILWLMKCITNGTEFEKSSLDLQEPSYPTSNTNLMGSAQMRSFALKRLVLILQKWVSWMEQPVPVEHEEHPRSAITQKQFKSTLEEGIKKFNIKPKHGIQFLIQNNCIASNTTLAIANFLFQNGHSLDKTSLGDYLGELEFQDLMRAFVDLYDFRDLSFLSALRLLLTKFRLPGEAQKIDRIMLKFAERFTLMNPEVFANADTAYILAYSVIMLNTDLHNPQVKNRMTTEDFIKNNRGIDDKKDLPRALLESIYSEIRDDEIKLDQKVKLVQAQGFVPGQKQENAMEDSLIAIEKEFRKLESKGKSGHLKDFQELSSQKIPTELQNESATPSPRQSVPNSPMSDIQSAVDFKYVKASHPDHIRDMFQLVWTSLLTAFSHPLQYSDLDNVVEDALNGFIQACHIACKFKLKTEKDAFVTTLSKYTFLSSLSDITSRNSMTVIALLDIAAKEGDYLAGNWHVILSCISELDRLRILPSSGESLLRSESNSSLNEPKRKDSNLISQPTFMSSRKITAPRAQRNNIEDTKMSESQIQEIVVKVDKILSASSNLSGPSICEFVQCMCQISEEELSSKNPRMFCLSKLVEISYYNMERIRVEWTQLWQILGHHFYKVGIHTNQQIAAFAVDSLRQLSMKFMEKEELPNFKFQREFLNPFSQIIEDSNYDEIRDLVLRCINQIVQSKFQAIKSGWATICSILFLSSKSVTESVVSLGFDTMKSLSSHYLLLIDNSSFSEYLLTLAEFCNCKAFPKISLQSIELLHSILDLCNATKFEDQETKMWLPILIALQEIVLKCDLEVRTRALTYLFDSLNTLGVNFNSSFWKIIMDDVLGNLFKLLDDNDSNTIEETNIWLSTTMIQVLRHYVEFYSKYFEELQSYLNYFLNLLQKCILHGSLRLFRK